MNGFSAAETAIISASLIVKLKLPLLGDRVRQGNVTIAICDVDHRACMPKERIT